MAWRTGCVLAGPTRAALRALAGLLAVLAGVAVLGSGGCTGRDPRPADRSPHGALTATLLWTRLTLVGDENWELNYVTRIRNDTDHAVDPILVTTLHEKSPAPGRDTVALPRLRAGKHLDLASSVFHVQRPAPRITFDVAPARRPMKLSLLRPRQVKLESVPESRLGPYGAQFRHGLFLLHGRITNTTSTTIDTQGIWQQAVLYDHSGKIVAAGGSYGTDNPHMVPPDGSYPAARHYVLPSGKVARATLMARG